MTETPSSGTAGRILMLLALIQLAYRLERPDHKEVQLFQIDVVQLIEVEAGFAGFVPTNSVHNPGKRENPGMM